MRRLTRHSVRPRYCGPPSPGKPTIQTSVTSHNLRRTFASLLHEAGVSPAYVMAQMGDTSSALALEVYAKKMERQQ